MKYKIKRNDKAQVTTRYDFLEDTTLALIIVLRVRITCKNNFDSYLLKYLKDKHSQFNKNSIIS